MNYSFSAVQSILRYSSLNPKPWYARFSGVYLSSGRIAGRGSRRGCLGWAVGTLRRQRPAALGLTETFAVLFAYLQRNKRSGQTQHTDTDSSPPWEMQIPNLYQMPSSWQQFKCHMCKGRNNKQCAAYCNIVTRKHFDMSVATYEYMKYQLKKTKQKK